MAKYILKTTQTFGSKTLAPDAVTYDSDWSKISMKEKVSSSLHCLWMLVTKHFNTHNVQPRNISEPLTPKTKPGDNQFYMHCVKRYFLCANRFQGSNFMALFTLKKKILLQLLQFWSSYCFHCDTDQL